MAERWVVRTSSVPNRKWGFVVLALFSTFVVAFLASLATYVFYRTKVEQGRTPPYAMGYPRG
jgi:hypothetical protein